MTSLESPQRIAEQNLSLAQRHLDQGDTATAMKYAYRADEAAAKTDDWDLRRAVIQFLLNESGEGLGLVHLREDGSQEPLV
ncbi:hypothetical protein BST95_15055 [Halioglobus japonicus]|uniref:Uncharacterized protein n=1 Tax=Halioglobus japonicus TaxID=930805 RepID=A0AAP8MH19_9GAMM|nr:hypothetical protein [Halioglobus japonicus]AQA19360.1 hypothetical protein BST95_15055 [Halioglobus japonicus]PLW87590.1 hypothetical protein C0029_03130 [Halioglobus japonicus]GHD07656.1 hypothetical protein GCM10007052_03710 [Halioglobus japonicus]